MQSFSCAYCVLHGFRHNCPLKTIPLLPCMAGPLRCVGARVLGSCARASQLSVQILHWSTFSRKPRQPHTHLLLCLIMRSLSSGPIQCLLCSLRAPCSAQCKSIKEGLPFLFPLCPGALRGKSHSSLTEFYSRIS